MTYATAVTDSTHFNQTFLDCMEDAVRSVLGEQVLESLFFHLQTYYGLRRDEIPNQLETFFPALEKAFGQKSGKTVGRFIIRVFYVKLGLKFDGMSNRRLPDYVGDARRQLGLMRRDD